MKCFLSPEMERFRPFVEALDRSFDEGELIFSGRNTLRAFTVEGEQLVVKQFRTPSGINRWVYGHLRQSKARRAYANAVQLLALGIPTPEPIAWREDYSGGLLTTCYLVTRRSEYHDLKEATEAFPAPHTLPILDGFAAFTMQLHERGVLHDDFNNSNTQFREESDGSFSYELIDVNRMAFKGRPLTRKEALHNLRRLTCPLTAYAYIMNRYGELRGWHPRYTQLDCAEQLIGFIRRRDRRRSLKRLFRGKKKVTK